MQPYSPNSHTCKHFSPFSSLSLASCSHVHIQQHVCWVLVGCAAVAIVCNPCYPPFLQGSTGLCLNYSLWSSSTLACSSGDHMRLIHTECQLCPIAVCSSVSSDKEQWQMLWFTFLIKSIPTRSSISQQCSLFYRETNMHGSLSPCVHGRFPYCILFRRALRSKATALIFENIWVLKLELFFNSLLIHLISSLKFYITRQL